MLIRLFVQAIIGFAMHRPLRDLFVQTITLNILGKVSTDDILKYFSHSSKKTGFAFHANSLHCMKCQMIKQITILFSFFFFLLLLSAE